MEYLGYAAIGIAAGILGGFVGVGGGIIIIPLLILLFGYDQLKAQGTSLAILLPPIAVLLKHGVGKDLVINIILCLLFFVPGAVHAIWLVTR